MNHQAFCEEIYTGKRKIRELNRPGFPGEIYSRINAVSKSMALTTLGRASITSLHSVDKDFVVSGPVGYFELLLYYGNVCVIRGCVL